MVLLPVGSEERGVFWVGSIPVAILPPVNTLGHHTSIVALILSPICFLYYHDYYPGVNQDLLVLVTSFFIINMQVREVFGMIQQLQSMCIVTNCLHY